MPPWDHPRVCGEKLKIPCWFAPNVGSPPRVRGKVVCLACVCRDLGITPACAGKSLTIQKMTTRSRDHPRVCGEKCNPGFKGQGGSRITPACAGKRPSLAPVPGACGDHPRVCGEKAYSLVINGSEWGSPPRVRGQARGWPAVRSKPRITPACAGKSCG